MLISAWSSDVCSSDLVRTGLFCPPVVQNVFMTTVVFADLVGSTSMFERLGDETASRFVTQLVGALSQVFEQHSGRVVKLLGHGLFVVFSQEDRKSVV